MQEEKSLLLDKLAVDVIVTFPAFVNVRGK